MTYSTPPPPPIPFWNKRDGALRVVGALLFVVFAALFLVPNNSAQAQQTRAVSVSDSQSAQRITAEDVADDCGEIGFFYGVDNAGATQRGGTSLSNRFSYALISANPVNYCYVQSDVTKSCYARRPGFSAADIDAETVILLDGDFDTISKDKHCDDIHPACHASGKVERIAGNKLAGCGAATTASCQSVHANSDTDNSGGCACTIGGTFPNCNAPVRAVSVSDNQANGAVSANWAGLATVVAEGESGNAPVAATVTFTATPDAGYYVTVWTGACATPGTTGENDAPAAVQTCVVSAGTGAIVAGATFAAIEPCASRNRIQTDATTCGACKPNHATANSADADDGTATCEPADNQRITAADVRTYCGNAAAGTPPSFLHIGTSLRNPFVDGGFEYCSFQISDPGKSCYSLNPGVFLEVGQTLHGEDTLELDRTHTCDSRHRACASHEEQVTDGNPFSGCQTTNSTCQSADANSVADTQPAGTTCTCPHGGTFVAGQSDGCNPAPTTRAVTIDPSTNGNVVLTVNGAEVAAGDLGAVSAEHPLEFSATPSAGYYVTVWTGACATPGTTGENDDPATPQTCVVPAGSGDIEAGAVFAAIADCATDNRVQDSATRCGVCASPRYWDGTACTDALFDATTFATQCTDANGGHGAIYQTVSGAYAQVGSVCFNFTAGNCYLLTNPNANTAGSAEVDGDNYGFSELGTSCHLKFPACASHEEQAISGNQLGGCATTTASCQSVDANSDTDNSGGCTCPHGGTFTAGQSDGCDAAATTRAVTIGDSENGNVVLTVNGAEVSGTDLLTVPVGAELMFSAVPANNGYYVSGWTGDCLNNPSAGTGEGDAVGGTAKTCVVEAGSSDVSAGATFAAVRDCGDENRKEADGVLSCGTCVDDYEDVGGSCLACTVANSGSTGGAACGCVSGFADPDTDDATLECAAILSASDCNTYGGGLTDNNTACDCSSARGFSGDRCDECASPNVRTTTDGGTTISCEAPTSEEVCNRAVGGALEFRNGACVSQCGAGQQRDSGTGACVACGAGTFNPTAGSTCDVCNGITGDGSGNKLDSGATSCAECENGGTRTDADTNTCACAGDYYGDTCGSRDACPANSSRGSDDGDTCECDGGYRVAAGSSSSGTDVVCELRGVSVSDGPNDGGAVSANWASATNPIGEGGNGNARTDEEITFTATPEAGYYVSGWTGDCDGNSSAGTGEGDDAGGTAKTCVVEAGSSDVLAGATFAAVRNCVSENRKEADGVLSCGTCVDDYEETGGSCSACTVSNSGSTGGAACGCDSGFADPDAGTSSDNGSLECAAVITDCMNGGTPDSSKNNTDCDCSGATHSRNPTTKLCAVERVATTRAVSISDNQANGAVSATWAGLATAVAEGESGNAPTDAAVTITADPDATHYVAEWTGACADAANPTSNPTGSASAADETQTCVVAAGTGAVEAGALFAEAANDECAPTNPCGANSVCADPTPTATSTGDYECGCADGFSGPDTVGEATTCADVDECATSNGGCDAEEKCVNLPGSFECAALPKVEITTPAGRLFEAVPAPGTDCVIWKWTGSCKDVNATEDDCTPTGEGMVTVGVVFDCGN